MSRASDVTSARAGLGKRGEVGDSIVVAQAGRWRTPASILEFVSRRWARTWSPPDDEGRCRGDRSPRTLSIVDLFI
jgi:hypothetical protein